MPPRRRPHQTGTAAGPVGFAQEFAERLAETGNLAAADREDRAALAKFYAGRQQEPVWTDAAGLTPAAAAAIAEMRRADDWGLDAAAFQVPALLRLRPLARQPCRCRDRAQPRHPEVCAPCPRRPRRAHLAQPQPRSQAAAARSRPGHRPGIQGGEPRCLSAIPAPAASAVRGPAPEIPGLEAGAVRSPIRAHPRRAGKAARKPRAPPPRRPSARRVLVNMEEWRWMPESLGDFFVWVNIPEYTLRVVKAGKIIHTERVIVGKRDTQTPVFSQDLEQVIFHPFWGIPEFDQAQRRAAEPGARQLPASWSATTCASSAAGATSIRRPSTGPAPTSASSTSISRPVPPTCWAS